MYEEYYGFKKLPFSITPDPEFVFMSSSHHEALAQMMYGIQERKCLMVVTGEVGVGKTTMIYTLLSQVEADAKIAILFDTHVDSLSLYRYMFADYSIEEKPADRAETVLFLRKFLEDRLNQNKKTILIIDESHNMSEEIFNEVVFLTNLETRTSKLMQIILVGQPELKHILNSHKFRQLKQRINLRTEIRPLTYKDTKAYILHRLTQAGTDRPKIFSETAIDLIYRYSKGLPRLINTICDNALLIGLSRKKKIIEEDIIRETFEDLMEIPVEEPDEISVETTEEPLPTPAPAMETGAAAPIEMEPVGPPSAEQAAVPEDGERQEVRIVRRIVQLPDGRQVEQKVRKIRKIKKHKPSARLALPPVVDLPEKIEIVRITHKANKEMIPALLGDDPGAVRQFHVFWNKLQSMAQQQKARVFGVTSSLPQEGKTVTSVNLSATIAQEPGVRVLLIDADLRKPKIHEILGIEKKFGLAHVLQGKCSFNQAFYRYELKNLFVMPAGEEPMDPIALLISPKMESVLEQARGMFHYVIIDSPPVIPIPDTVELASMVDGVILAVKARVTPREVIARTLDDLYQKPVLGVVLNDIDGRLAMAKGDKYGYGYGYGYGRYGKPTRPRSVVASTDSQ